MLCRMGIVMAACAIPFSQTPLSKAPSPTSSAQIVTDSIEPASSLPFEGLWISGSDDLSQWVSGNVDPSQPYELLAITARTLYWVRGGAEDGVSEELYEIASYDLQANHITLIKRWIRHNGAMYGFDYNPWLLTCAVQGNQLRITIAGESEFPAEATSDPYYRRWRFDLPIQNMISWPRRLFLALLIAGWL